MRESTRALRSSPEPAGGLAKLEGCDAEGRVQGQFRGRAAIQGCSLEGTGNSAFATEFTGWCVWFLRFNKTVSQPDQVVNASNIRSFYIVFSVTPLKCKRVQVTCEIQQRIPHFRCERCYGMAAEIRRDHAPFFQDCFSRSEAAQPVLMVD